jgi:hypothetical protein
MAYISEEQVYLVLYLNPAHSTAETQHPESIACRALRSNSSWPRNKNRLLHWNVRM